MKHLSPEQVGDLIKAAQSDRDRLLLSIIYQHALRVSEALSLTKGHVVRGYLQLKPKKKGKRADERLDTATAARLKAHQTCPRVLHIHDDIHDDDGHDREAQDVQPTPALAACHSVTGQQCTNKAEANQKCIDDAGWVGNHRIHAINPDLGELREVVIEVARSFEVQKHLLERINSDQSPDKSRALRSQTRARNKAWFLIDQQRRKLIAALVDAKGSCSCRVYDCETGRFVRRYPNGHGSFRNVFGGIVTTGIEFMPPFQPNLVSSETAGLPPELLKIAQQTLP